MILADFAHIEGSNEALPGLRAITGGIDKIDFEWLNEDGRGKCRKQYPGDGQGQDMMPRRCASCRG